MDLKAFRKKHKLTQAALAEKIGVTKLTVCRWEIGYIKKPHKIIEEKISKIFNDIIKEKKK